MALSTAQKLLIGGGVTGVAVFALWRFWPKSEEESVDWGEGGDEGWAETTDEDSFSSTNEKTPPISSSRAIPRTTIDTSAKRTVPKTSTVLVSARECPPGTGYNPMTGGCEPLVVE